MARTALTAPYTVKLAWWTEYASFAYQDTSLIGHISANAKKANSLEPSVVTFQTASVPFLDQTTKFCASIAKSLPDIKDHPQTINVYAGLTSKVTEPTVTKSVVMDYSLMLKQVLVMTETKITAMDAPQNAPFNHFSNVLEEIVPILPFATISVAFLSQFTE